MKKRMLAVILSALLVATASACNHTSDDNNPEKESTPITKDTENSHTENDHIPEEESTPVTEGTENLYPETEVGSDPSTDEEAQSAAKGSIVCNGNYNTKTVYEINQSGELTLHIENWSEDHLVSAVSLSSDTEIEAFVYAEKAIAVHNEHACLFLKENDEIIVVRLEKGSPDETVTRLEVNEDEIGIAANFIDENIGYLFTFQEVSDGPAGGSKVSGLFITKDGGNTWDLINVQNAASISLREHIIFAKMVSEDVGLISGNYFGADYNFCERTLLTTDGGLNWVNVADLPQINHLQWATVTDFAPVDDYYVMTVRYTISETNGTYSHAKYKLIDMNTWIRIS